MIIRSVAYRLIGKHKDYILRSLLRKISIFLSIMSLRLSRWKKTLLMKFPLLKEQIYQFRSVLEPKYLNKHLLNKNIFSKLKSTNNNYIVSNNLTNTVISGLEYFNLLHFFQKGYRSRFHVFSKTIYKIVVIPQRVL